MLLEMYLRLSIMYYFEGYKQ